MAGENFAYSYNVVHADSRGKRARLKWALCSSANSPSVCQLSSGEQRSALSVCCRAFHTFLCLVSKLVLTWEIWPLTLLCSLSFLPMYVGKIYPHQNPNSQERPLQGRDTRRDTKEIPESFTYGTVCYLSSLCLTILPSVSMFKLSRWLCVLFKIFSASIVKMLLRLSMYVVFCVGFFFYLPYFLFSCLSGFAIKRTASV